jgi:hypothetical protein
LYDEGDIPVKVTVHKKLDFNVPPGEYDVQRAGNRIAIFALKQPKILPLLLVQPETYNQWLGLQWITVVPEPLPELDLSQITITAGAGGVRAIRRDGVVMEERKL